MTTPTWNLRGRHRKPGERYAIRFVYRDGELLYRRCQPRSDFVDNAEVAVERLRAGHVVWVLQVGWLCTAIQRAFAETGTGQDVV